MTVIGMHPKAHSKNYLLFYFITKNHCYSWLCRCCCYCFLYAFLCYILLHMNDNFDICMHIICNNSNRVIMQNNAINKMQFQIYRFYCWQKRPENCKHMEQKICHIQINAWCVLMLTYMYFIGVHCTQQLHSIKNVHEWNYKDFYAEFCHSSIYAQFKPN